MLRVHVAPVGVRAYLRDAVADGGGTVVDDIADADALVWTAPADPAGLRALLARRPSLPWVQLPWAGIEHYRSVLDRERVWTAGQGVYADDVAEHALALTLAVLRDFVVRARATSWTTPSGRSLRGARVCVFGAGGITTSLVGLLAPFRVTLTVVRRKSEPFLGATRTYTLEEKHVAVAGADVVILALSLTPETERLVDDAFIAAMKPGAALINVARGRHVDPDALLRGLTSGHLGGAGLDVTDPEPLPEGHPLFRAPNCLITPHCANTPEMAVPVLKARVAENVRRRLKGEPLLGVVDVDAGY